MTTLVWKLSNITKTWTWAKGPLFCKGQSPRILYLGNYSLMIYSLNFSRLSFRLARTWLEKKKKKARRFRIILNQCTPATERCQPKLPVLFVCINQTGGIVLMSLISQGCMILYTRLNTWASHRKLFACVLNACHCFPSVERDNHADADIFQSYLVLQHNNITT